MMYSNFLNKPLFGGLPTNYLRSREKGGQNNKGTRSRVGKGLGSREQRKHSGEHKQRKIYQSCQSCQELSHAYKPLKQMDINTLQTRPASHHVVTLKKSLSSCFSCFCCFYLCFIRSLQSILAETVLKIDC